MPPKRKQTRRDKEEEQLLCELERKRAEEEAAPKTEDRDDDGARASTGVDARVQVDAVAVAATKAHVQTQRPRAAGSDVVPQRQRLHAFNHAPAALRIFRFAADSAPRVLQLAHISAFLRECAVEFGSADAALPGALRCEYAAKRFFSLRCMVESNAARCPWLAEKLLACRSGAPIPAAALAPDVTRHTVNWDAPDARRNEMLQPMYDGLGLRLCGPWLRAWAQGPDGFTTGRHFFSITILPSGTSLAVSAGWLDNNCWTSERDEPGTTMARASGAVYRTNGCYQFGTAPLAADSILKTRHSYRPCTVGCLIDLDATPARMTVFVDGEPLPVQCPYDFPKDRAWFPSVGVYERDNKIFTAS
jgi:hypothetical protein